MLRRRSKEGREKGDCFLWDNNGGEIKLFFEFYFVFFIFFFILFFLIKNLWYIFG